MVFRLSIGVLAEPLLASEQLSLNHSPKVVAVRGFFQSLAPRSSGILVAPKAGIQQCSGL